MAYKVLDKWWEPNETEQARQDHKHRHRKEKNDNSHACKEDGNSIRFDEGAFPKQMDRFRDRFTLAGAKDDSRDAEVMASALRTDPHCLRLLAALDPTVIELREWSRIASDLARSVTGSPTACASSFGAIALK